MIDLKRLRRDNGLTQEQLGEILGYSQSFISQIEKGERELPSEGYEIISNKFNISNYLKTSELNEPETKYETKTKSEDVRFKLFEITKPETIDDLKKEISGLNDKMSLLNRLVESLEKSNDDLRKNIEDLRQRNNCLEIMEKHGILANVRSK